MTKLMGHSVETNVPDIARFVEERPVSAAPVNSSNGPIYGYPSHAEQVSHDRRSWRKRRTKRFA